MMVGMSTLLAAIARHLGLAAYRSKHPGPRQTARGLGRAVLMALAIGAVGIGALLVLWVST